MRVRMKFRTKLALAFAGVGLATVAILFGLSWHRGRDAQLQGLRLLLTTTAAAIAPDIDGDLHASLAAKTRDEDLGDAAYAALRARVVRVLSLSPRFKAVYTLSTAGLPRGTGRYVVSDKNEDIGNEYDYGRFPAMERGLVEPSADADLVDDGDDVTISGYAPIRDRAGKTVGLLGIDVDASTVREMQRRLLALLAGAAAAGLVLSGALSWFFASRISRPVAALSAAMGKVAAGDYGTRASWPSGDEFETLFSRFNEMAEGLEERQRLKQALALAMEIQQHLLPSGPPHVPGLDVAGVAQYCDETGGDYYDYPRVWALPGGRVALTVGDVTGHGIVAALLMASARAVLRSHAEREETPDEVLALVNRHLVRDATAGKFMTLFYGVLDPGKGTLEYANAGQGGCLVYRRANDVVEHLPASGPPLGIVPGCQFPRRTVEGLRTGDVVVLATDGVWEATDPDGAFYEMERLVAWARAHAGDPADAVANGLLADVHAFRRGGPQADDITVVVARLVPHATSPTG